ncbi:group II intron reverse transcriptase/maturase [Nocardia sp. NPDC004168]|uniref:group II intron reverse transcriptase/maturase n=1 Tax=Nocardia sp. NPDC004168 TaxID=3154452 RepID=UPI0033A9CB5D
MLNEDDHTIVNVYGAEWRGIVQYYLLAGNVARLYRLLWVMETSLLKTLANKHRYTVSKMARKYAATITTPYGPRKCFEAQIAAALPHGPVEPHLRADRTPVRTRERYAQVHPLLAQGHSLRSIGRELGLARGTIRRFARAASPEELLVHNRTGYTDQSVLDEFMPYLHQRWNQGTTNAARLFAEIKARGYRGQANLVRAYLQPFRTTAHIPAPPPPPPSVRRVTAWIMTKPSRIDPADQRRLDAILAASPELDALAGHVRGFVTPHARATRQ